MSENSSSSRQILLPLVFCGGIAAGIAIGYTISSPISGRSGEDIQRFREVISRIEADYVDTVDTGKLVDQAIANVLENLDPHSSFIAASDRESANEDLRGNFDGIGIEFNIFHDTVVVVTPLSGGPSEALGIRSGDKILTVDGKPLSRPGVKNADVSKALKGPRGTEVNVSIKRGIKEIDFKIIRDKIPQHSVDVAYMVDQETGYIKINQFSMNTTEEFNTAMAKLKSQGMKKLLLDLQGNPGGYMQRAIEIADEFLSAGKVIVSQKGKDNKYNSTNPSTSHGSFESGELIVLINEGSASASEILAGALQDNDRALIVGRRSFGKGLVQHPFGLNDKSELRLTVSRYYTPSGRSIQKPYDNPDEYNLDIVSRFNRGEFFSAESIHFNDSLKYNTVNGRTVYGGGGIMPDYFVPLDTTLNSHYLNELYNASVIQEYTFGYANTHKDKLKEQGYDKFLNDFEVSDAMIQELVQLGIRNKVTPDYKVLKSRSEIFKIHVKAQIARNIWGNDGFYPVYNKTNEIFNKARDLFDRIPELARVKN